MARTSDSDVTKALRSKAAKPAKVAKPARVPASASVSPWAPLASVAAWTSTSEKRRLRLGKELALALGSDWRPSLTRVGKDRLVELLHEPTALRFLVVPGGAFTAGMRDGDLAIARRMEFDDVETLATLEAGPEAKPAQIDPFLCARAPLLEGHARALRKRTEFTVGDTDGAVTFTRKQANAAMAAFPASFRFLKPLEWEYVARDGGVTTFINGDVPEGAKKACEDLNEHRFDPRRKGPGSNALGVWGLPLGDWVASKNVRVSGSACGGAAMDLPWPSADGIALCFAGLSVVGGRENASCVRVAVDLPTPSL